LRPSLFPPLDETQLPQSISLLERGFRVWLLYCLPFQPLRIMSSLRSPLRNLLTIWSLLGVAVAYFERPPFVFRTQTACPFSGSPSGHYLLTNFRRPACSHSLGPSPQPFFFPIAICVSHNGRFTFFPPPSRLQRLDLPDSSPLLGHSTPGRDGQAAFFLFPDIIC